MQLHLLDATYELFRAYFGKRPTRTSPTGQDVTAVHGLIDSTLSLLREPEVTHVAAFFDTVIESFRNELYDGYKTGEGIAEELFAQFPLAERSLEAIGVRVYRMDEFEADDGIAAAALRFTDEVDRVVMLSPDKDLSQVVVGHHIVAYDRLRQRLLDEAGVWEKFGVAPESIPDYLALVGDSADGIPGIPSWGAKSASLLLAEYRHIEQIPPDERSWRVTVRGAARLAENLRENIEDARLFRTLTTLRYDVPIEEDLQDLEWMGAPREEYLSLCEELGFESLQDRPHRWR
ncbi:MAG TPA: 5'-3' exonuclease H3TH domain-containing protein [Acidimicrobiia bacterium]|nr:5'-3' exonuclease H3TH domain-containing protein [Acidimicrobiia bacterium]